MKKILEDTNTFLASLIGLVGGIIWGINSKWDYEPLILISISAIGLIIFLAIKFFGENSRPNVEMELNHTGSSRGPIMMAPGLSPKNEEGYYLHEENGIYHYDFEHKYDLILRNNSIQNAYNVKVYVEIKYFLTFWNEINLRDPLIVNEPKIIKAKYNFGRNLTTQQSFDELSIKFNDELKKVKFLVEYQDEQRKTYFTEFFPPTTNIHLNKNPKIDKTKFREL